MCLHIVLEENVSFRPKNFFVCANILLTILCEAIRYVSFVLPPLKRNITDKEELNFDVMCFVFLKVSFRSIK